MVERDWIQIRRELHEIPELGFQEHQTQAYLLEFIQTLPQDHITVEKWRTGLFVFVKGSVGAKTLGYRADIDGLPIQEETGYSFASKHEGYMHACGHDLHMTIALGALTEMATNPIDDHVLFIFQPAEEGPGGAEPMQTSDFFGRHRPDRIFALHIDPSLPVGTVSTKPGILFANTSELFIDFHGKGGHAAYPHRTTDMLLAASAFNLQAQQLVSRIADPLNESVLTLGKMTAGTAGNIIAEHARIEGTMRTLDPNVIQLFRDQIRSLLKGIETRYYCKTTVDFGSSYYMVDNDPEAVEVFQSAIGETPITYREAPISMAGEDFGYFLKDIPGFMFWLGVESEYGLHHSRLKPNEDAIQIGIEAVIGTLKKFNGRDLN